MSQLEFLKLESVKQWFCALTGHYELVTVKYICLKHPCTHTLTVACYSLLINCFDLLVPEFADEWNDDMVMWRVLTNDSTFHLHIIFYFALISAVLHSLQSEHERETAIGKGKTEGKGNKISTDP